MERISQRIESFSGREIAKLAVAWQVLLNECIILLHGGLRSITIHLPVVPQPV